MAYYDDSADGYGGAYGAGGALRRNPLTAGERRQVEKDLETLSGDPLRHELLDTDYDQFVNDQFETAYGGNSPEPKAFVRGDYVPRPDPSHFEISAPVGPGLENRYHDVVKIKKGLASSGAQPFDLTRERSTDVNDRLFDGIRTLQDMVGAKADGIVNPLGETARKATPLMSGEGASSFANVSEKRYIFPMPSRKLSPSEELANTERDRMEAQRRESLQPPAWTEVGPNGSVFAPIPGRGPTHRDAERRSMDLLERDRRAEDLREMRRKGVVIVPMPSASERLSSEDLRKRREREREADRKYEDVRGKLIAMGIAPPLWGENPEEALDAVNAVMYMRQLVNKGGPAALKDVYRRVGKLENQGHSVLAQVLRQKIDRARWKPETAPWSLDDQELIDVYRAVGGSAKLLSITGTGSGSVPKKYGGRILGPVGTALGLASLQQEAMQMSYERELRRRGIIKGP
jgi:hypothetical protein